MLINWHCKDCRRGGTLQTEKGEQISSVLQRIEAAHLGVSPFCQNPMTKREVIELGFPKEVFVRGGTLERLFKRAFRRAGIIPA